MSGMSGTYEIMASVTTTPSTTELRRISRRAAAVAPSATLAVDAKAKALQAAGEHVDRLRRRASRTSRRRRTSSRPPSRRAGTRPTTTTRRPAGIPALREAIAAKTKRDSGLEVSGRPGAGHQRRQAGGGQRVRRPVRPRRRGPRARPVLDDLPRVDRPGRRDAGVRLLRRDDGLPLARSTTSRRRGRPTPRRCCSCPRRNPTGAVYPRDEIEAIGRWAVEQGHLGRSPTRSTSTSSTAAPSTTPCRCSCPSWPTAAWSPTAWPRPTP